MTRAPLALRDQGANAFEGGDRSSAYISSWTRYKMGSFYHFNADHALVFFRSTGRFTEHDFINLLRAAYDDPRHTPNFSHVWDSRDVEELVVDPNVINMYRDLLNEYESQIAREKIAIVAVRTITRTFSSMLARVGTGHPATFQLFDDLEAAAEWVGVPASVLTEVPGQAWTEI